VFVSQHPSTIESHLFATVAYFHPRQEPSCAKLERSSLLRTSTQCRNLSLAGVYPRKVPTRVVQLAVSLSGGNFITFLSVISARVFVSGKPFQLSIMFVGKARSLPEIAAPERCFTQVGSGFT
jgi:hypothetical protein